MTEIIISGTVLSFIATLAAMIIDKHYSKSYFISYIASVAIGTVLMRYSIPSTGGVAIAAIQGIMIYILSKNKVYATYMTYAVYTTYYIGDLLAGMIYVLFLKIELMQYFSSAQGTALFAIVTLILSIPVILILRLITMKKLRFKEIELSNKAKLAMYTFTPIALFIHAYLANRTRTSGIQEEILKQSLLLNSTAVVMFMFGIYCILSTCIKKDAMYGKAFKHVLENGTEEERSKLLESLEQNE